MFVKFEVSMKMNMMLMTECLASVCKVWRYYENECHVNDIMFVKFVMFKASVKFEGIMKMNVMLMTECL